MSNRPVGSHSQFNGLFIHHWQWMDWDWKLLKEPIRANEWCLTVHWPTRLLILSELMKPVETFDLELDLRLTIWRAHWSSLQLIKSMEKLRRIECNHTEFPLLLFHSVENRHLWNNRPTTPSYASFHWKNKVWLSWHQCDSSMVRSAPLASLSLSLSLSLSICWSLTDGWRVRFWWSIGVRPRYPTWAFIWGSWRRTTFATRSTWWRWSVSFFPPL